MTKAKPKKKPTFTEVGNEAKAKAQRAYLLEELDAQNWNLTKTAEALGMGGRAAVIRALNDLAPEEYERAKNDGRVRPGVRPDE